MRIVLFLLLLVITAVGIAAPPSAGIYADRSRDGHGLDLQIVGNRVVGIFLTFEDDGQPYWYLVDGPWNGEGGELEIIEFRYAAGATPATTIAARYPGARMTRVASADQCGAGDARPGATALYDFRFNIAGEDFRWCMELIVPSSLAPESALSGSWYPGEADSGWGLISYLYGEPGAVQSFHSLYVYDATGRPRWSYANESSPDTSFALDFKFPRGYCRTCPSVPLTAQSAGTANIVLVTPRTDTAHNKVTLALNYPYGAGGRFDRAERTLLPITVLPKPPLVAATREGLVRGTALGTNGAKFLGVPYVTPPTGNLRWRAPQSATPRVQPFQANMFSPACPQNATSDGIYGSVLGVRSENCLYLNVWTPELREGALKPVMVWIHGGGLVQGSSGETRPDGVPVYDGARLADDGVVAVSINYRLGPLGYLAMRDFAGESPDHPTAGNYGLLDQIAALRWVRDNIAAFGGDPSRVTIFGESAGGVSTCALLASPLARGLFHRAIMQSGGCQRAIPSLETAPAGQEAAYTQGARITSTAGCSGQADPKTCMRSLSWENLIALAQPTVGFGRPGDKFGLIQDSFSLIEPPGLAIAAGRAAPVPLIAGINADELTALLPASARPATVAAYEALILQTFPSIGALVLQQYPASAYPEPWYAYTDLLDDLQFACPNAAFTRNFANANNPTWRYVYTHVFANASSVYGAFHGADIAFVFGPTASATAAEADLAAQMQRQWTQFAATGDPNAAGLPNWPRRLGGDDVAIEFDDVSRGLIRDYRKPYCDFWSRYIVF
ncbi:MAG: carboxylesterase family protein [Ahniella sp.]|nr:carboxylesterase family protein [Ahniella sp.]